MRSRAPERVLAACTVAGAAPHDAAGLDWLAGQGEENVDLLADPR
jgi:hypothetical protein